MSSLRNPKVGTLQTDSYFVVFCFLRNHVNINCNIEEILDSIANFAVDVRKVYQVLMEKVASIE